jgi:broad specificity phosphatase PhoE
MGLNMRFDVFTYASRIALLLLLALMVPSGAEAQAETTVVYLVRHAEKADDSADPPLSPEGEMRAIVLAAMLSDAGITRVMSSDYIRTRRTAQPVAGSLGLAVEIYDPRDLPGLAEMIQENPGRYLIAGHSNTTPAMVELLGGDPGEPIREADEYDRLYVVTLDDDGTSTVLLRYGASGSH